MVTGNKKADLTVNVCDGMQILMKVGLATHPCRQQCCPANWGTTSENAHELF